MKGIKLILFFFFLSSFASAQIDTNDLKTMSVRELKKLGKNALLQNDPNSAVIYLERALKINKADYDAQFLLGEAYRRTRNYSKAEQMYAIAYKSNPAKNAAALFYHGEMLKAAQQYDKAKEDFVKFKKEYKGNDRSLKKFAAKEVISCDSAKLIILHETKIVVTHLDTTINKVHVESSPISMAEDKMIYSALRTDKHEYIVEGDTNFSLLRKFYSAKKENDKWVFTGEWEEGKFNAPEENIGNATFSPDGKRMYFTRCKPDWRDKMICAIYVCENKDGKWSEPVKLDKQINNPRYTSTQPTVAFDPVKGQEIVYFVSDKKGGRGGLDVWYFIYDRKKKTYKEPKNAGNKVNTEHDEVTPYYDDETHSMYFSSDGWPGLGGLDVYKTMGGVRSWTPAENLGQPVNSGADDLYFVVSKTREDGFFTSNRKGSNSIKNETCCDDIYEYKRTEYIHILLKGVISEQVDSVHKKVLPNSVVDLYLKDKTTGENILVKSELANQDGGYDFQLEAGKEYFVTAKKEGFLSTDGKAVSTMDITSNKSLEQDFVLHTLPKEPIRIKNIEYEFDRAELTANSKIIIDTTIYKILKANPQIIVELSSHTDSKGTDAYNEKLSQKRAESVVNYLIAKGIDKKRMVPKGYGESKPIAPNTNVDGSDNPEGRQHNRRTEFKVIGEMDVEVINEDD